MKKKLISLALVCAMILALGATALATDTTIEPTGGNPYDVTPKPGNANTTVEFSVDPAYTVTIPARVVLEKGDDGKYSNSGDLKAENVFLNEGKEIVVSLTSASKFNLKTSAESTYNLPYTASTVAFGSITDKTNGGIVAKFQTSTAEQPVSVTFTTDETPRYAGTYTDPVVFTIEVKDIVIGG